MMTIVCRTTTTIKIKGENKFVKTLKNSWKYFKHSKIREGLTNPLTVLGLQIMPIWSHIRASFLHMFRNLASKLWNYVYYWCNHRLTCYEPVKYKLAQLPHPSRQRLNLVQRKILVLDLDETLVHSCHAFVRNTVRPGTPFDFKVKVLVDRQLVTFFVYKRPHVDFFLDVVSQWYDVVLFTASLEVYGNAVADKLDQGRNILRRRYYRQHCTPDFGSYTKDLSAICNDLTKICIVDNSPGAYRCFPDNAIPIQSYLTDPMDTALLKLLPLLDALRFTKDVRSVLSRNLHLHHNW